jgi:hypothetical protein
MTRYVPPVTTKNSRAARVRARVSMSAPTTHCMHDIVYVRTTHVPIGCLADLNTCALSARTPRTITRGSMGSGTVRTLETRTHRQTQPRVHHVCAHNTQSVGITCAYRARMRLVRTCPPRSTRATARYAKTRAHTQHHSYVRTRAHMRAPSLSFSVCSPSTRAHHAPTLHDASIVIKHDNIIN